MKGYNLLMPFADNSESFTNGFECGQLWEVLSSGKELEKHLVHLCNRPQIELICSFFARNYVLEEISDEWGELTTEFILKTAF